jgi:hypothetical protein
MPLDHHIKRDQEHQERLRRFVEELEEKRGRPRQEPPPAPAPMPRTPRQEEQLRLEQEAGRKRTEYYEEQMRNRPSPPPPDVTRDGTMVPVFRPRNYVHETKKYGK